VFGPAVAMVGAHAAAPAIMLLAGRTELVDRALWSVDLAANRTAPLESRSSGWRT
jgi:hypothetical protein